MKLILVPPVEMGSRQLVHQGQNLVVGFRDVVAEKYQLMVRSNSEPLIWLEIRATFPVPIWQP